MQRARMLDAAIDAIQEVGYAGMSVAEVIKRARVSRKTFYDVFRDRDDCFQAAFEDTLERAVGEVREAYERATSWREGMRAGLERMLALMDEEPAVARLWVVEALGASEQMLRRRAELLSQLAVIVDQGRPDLARRDTPTVTAEAVVGGVFEVIHNRLVAERHEPLVELVAPLMSAVVIHYLGPKAARRELDRPAKPLVRTRSEKAPRETHPLEGLKIRLTYRTVRVLMAAARQPGASNRELADAAGIVDQGQISKLLTRLEGLGLIESFGEGQIRGGANAWYLTELGLRLERATRPRQPVAGVKER